VSIGHRLAQALLAATLLVSAGFKAWHFLLERDFAVVLPMLRNRLLMSGLVLFEVVLACGLFTQLRRLAAWGIASIAVGGAVIVAWAARFNPVVVSCGCLGRVPLTPLEHSVLSSATFALAVVLIVGDSQGMIRPESGSRAQPE